MYLARLLPLVALLLAGCSPSSTPGARAPVSSAPSPLLGQKLSLSLPSSLGSLVTVGNGGQPLVMDFWSPECKPCKDSVPSLVRRQAELQAKGARLILVAVLAKDESTEIAKSTLASWGVSLPFLIDREQASQRAAGVTDLPATIVLDAQHNIRWIAPVNATANDVIGAVE